MRRVNTAHFVSQQFRGDNRTFRRGGVTGVTALGGAGIVRVTALGSTARIVREKKGVERETFSGKTQKFRDVTMAE